MPNGQRDFELRARIGYAIVTVLLAVGMALSVHRLSTVADGQAARLQAAEHEITLVERLRWSSEHIASTGRAYMLVGGPDLLLQVEDAAARFDAILHELLAFPADGPRARPRFAEVEQAVGEFLRVQSELLAARRQSADPRTLVQRFETELLPLRDRLDDALARLVQYKERQLDQLYRAARRERVHLEIRLYGLLGLLVLASFGIALYFARLLTRAYQQERGARETAHKALAARDELMAIVAHDLRNPLSAITMKAALLRKGATSDQLRQRAESIESVATRMEHLIRSMLDVTTMEAGKFSVTPGPCPVDQVLRETVAMFAPIAAARTIRLEQRVSEPGLVLLADRERVLQVLSNLLGNALKFTPAGGQVTLAVERRDGEVCVSVRDTGPGIAREHLPHLFDRFWQVDAAGKKKGTGLGLFIARGIVDAHGGRIWADSAPGRGAHFFFTLPLLAPDADLTLDARQLSSTSRR